MYNYSINTTYLDIEEIDQDTQYRKELLNAFMISEYKHEIIMDSIDISFKKYGEHPQVKLILSEVIKHSKLPFGWLDSPVAFTMLFSFDNFYYFHNALCELERNTNITTELFDKIIKNLQKK